MTSKNRLFPEATNIDAICRADSPIKVMLKNIIHLGSISTGTNGTDAFIPTILAKNGIFLKKVVSGGGNGLDGLKTHQNSRVKTFSGAPDRLALEFSRSDFSPSRYRVRSPIRADSGSRHRIDGAAPKWCPGGYFGRRITRNWLKFPKKLSTSSFRGSEFRRFWSGDSADVARWVYEIAQI